MSIELELQGLNCASCASKIEELATDLDGVESASLDFVNKKIKLETNGNINQKLIIEELKSIVVRLEPDVKVREASDQDSHDHHDHDHGDISKSDLYKILISGFIFVLGFILKPTGLIGFAYYFAAYLIVGYDVIIRAVRNIMAGIPFDENFLMTLATIGAFIIGEYPEAVAVMLFYQVGEYFQGLAVNNSRRSIKSLMDIRPDYANLLRDGQEIKIDPEEVAIGDHILVKPGEKVPLDGLIVEGQSYLDTSNITGESVPRSSGPGDLIYSGSVNQEGLLRVEVTKDFGQSTVSKILDLVENASSKKAPMENFISKFARIYTPAVVYIALAIGIIPSLFTGDFRSWAYKAFVFLVMSCPCALVISIPLSFFGGIGAASKSGILVKGGNYLEALNGIESLVFDKTGTITQGSFQVREIKSYGDHSQDQILYLAAHAEVHSNHPIATSIKEAYGKELDSSLLDDYREIAGKGVQVNFKDSRLLLGNKDLLEENSIKINEEDSIGTVVYLAQNDQHIATIIVADQLKEGVKESIEKLKEMGIKETIILSGDKEDIAHKVGNLAGVDHIYGDLLPQDKVSKLEEIMASKEEGKLVAFVGDGVNDAPVLARADLGIAMGGLGSDAAIEASDVVIMTDEISKISTALKISKNTKKIVTQNIGLAIGVKLLVLLLGILGRATMWQAVFADVGVSVIAILNSLRTLRVGD